MPVFEVEHNGEVYEVDATDEMAAASAFDAAPAPAAPAAAPAAPTPAPQGRSRTDELKRQLGLTGRAVAEGLGALPLVAMDAGVAVRNLATGSNYDSPSSMYTAGLDQIFPKRENLLEKGVGLAAGALASSRLPVPQLKTPTPVGFRAVPAGPNAVRNATLAEGRKAGYVVPPATSRPNIGNVLLESLGGKAQTQQVAGLRNQKITNDLARQALGLPKGTPLEPSTLASVRADAGKAYEAVASSGVIRTDGQYLDELAKLTEQSDIVAGSFKSLDFGATQKIKDLQTGLLEDTFDARAAVSLIRQLRETASAKFRAGGEDDIALARASREAAGIVEDMVMRSLRQAGKAKLADDFARARVLIAKTHAVEDALNPGTGNVVAARMTAELRKGKPLTGELQTIAKMGAAFRPDMAEVLGSPGVSTLDMAVGGIGGAAINPALLAWPASRYGARYGILSRPYQNLFAQPKTHAAGLLSTKAGPRAAGTATAIGLFGQDPYEEDL